MFENALLKLEVEVDEIAPHDRKGPIDCAQKLRPQLSQGLDIIQTVTRKDTRGAASLTPSENMKEIKSSMEKLGKRPAKRDSDSTIEKHPRLLKFVHGPLDVAMAILVCIHLFFMIATIELEEAASKYSLGLSADPGNSQGSLDFLEATEYIFFFIYFFDVLLRVYVLRSLWYCDAFGGLMVMNLFDAVLVIVGAFDLFIIPMVSGIAQASHTRSMRVVKLLRMVRTLRIVKTVAAFRQVRILIASCMASVGALGWSMVLLLVMQLSFALVICTALQGFIQDDAADYQDRLLLYNLYGSDGLDPWLVMAFDVDGDGTLSPQEWESALAMPYVQQYLQMLDVRIADCRQLFGILDDGTGAITIHEFCDWLKRVKGEARAADVVVLQHATEKAIRLELRERHGGSRHRLVLNQPEARVDRLQDSVAMPKVCRVGTGITFEFLEESDRQDSRLGLRCDGEDLRLSGSCRMSFAEGTGQAMSLTFRAEAEASRGLRCTRCGEFAGEATLGRWMELRWD
eukprot:Skav227493  [mRNA]  locus=scaffold282:113848:117214:+ [translate_table: standard]